MDSRLLDLISASLLFAAFVLIVSSMGGTAVPWSKSDTIDFGLLKYEVDTGSGTVTFDYADGVSDFDDCDGAGKATLSFSVFATLASVVALLAVIRRHSSPSRAVSLWYVVGGAGVAAVCCVIAWATWLGACHSAIKDVDALDVELGAGTALSMVGLALSGLVAVLYYAMAK